MKKQSKGITLIALVITIIILLILAGISIATLTNTGLFGKAKEAKDKSKNAQIEENIYLADYENEINKYINGSRQNNTDYSQYNDILKLLYSNAGEYQLPSTIESLINTPDIFNWVLNSQKNADYIISNPDIFINNIINNPNAMECFGKNEYISKLAIKNKTWRTAILSSKYLEKFNLGATTVPTMTSNTSPEGEAFASKYETASSPYQCFDGNDATVGAIARPYTLNGYIGYKFTKKVIPYYVSFLTYSDFNNYFSNIKIQASNDNNTWTDLTDVLDIPQSGWIYIKLEKNESYNEYQYIRIFQTTDKGAPYYAGAYTIQFYCK